MASGRQGFGEILPPGPARDLVDLFSLLLIRTPLSISQIAAEAGLSRGYVSEVLRGRKPPRQRVAVAVAQALRATSGEIERARKYADDLAELNRHQRSRVRGDPQPAAGAAQTSAAAVAGTVKFSAEALSRVLVASGQHRSRLIAREVDHAIPRDDVVESVLQALDRPEPSTGVHQPRVVPIRGAPGAGKTVVAGQLADAFTGRLGAAVLVVPCDQVLTTPSDMQGFDVAFGNLLRSKIGVVAAVKAIAEHLGRRMIVLFDTIDCVLDEHTRAPLVEFMSRVHDSGADIVLTCRRHDFNVLLQPDRRLGTLAPHVTRPIDIPPLTRDQVVDVTLGFLTAHDIKPKGGRKPFAQQVFGLAANKTPLVDVVVNPLLLVMLCQLFAETGIVPPDLTTTRLCFTYCRDRVTASRKYPDDVELAEAKHAVWQSMARELWRSSGRRLALDTARTALVSDRGTRRAFDDLCSEGVLVPRSTDEGRVGFLHQVIAEYSIAIHLRDAVPEELAALLDSLRRDPSARWYAWQIVRHLIALADADGAEHLLDQLDLTQIPAYRAAAFGAAAEWRPGILLRLAEQPAAVDDLCEALLSVQDEAVGEALRALAVVARNHPAHAPIVIKTAGELVGRGRVPADEETADLLTFVREIQLGGRPEADDHRDLADQLVGHLLAPAAARRVVLSTRVLAAARSLVPRATPVGVRAVIGAHLVSGVTVHDMSELRDQVLRHRRANNMYDGGLDLIAAAPPWAERGGEVTVPALLRFLDDGSGQSEQLRAAAVARAADGNPEVRPGLLRAFIETANGPGAQRLLICLQEAVKVGGARWVADALTARPVPAHKGSLGRVCGLLKTFTSQEPQLRYVLADWLTPALTADQAGTLDAYMRLVRDDETRFGSRLLAPLQLARRGTATGDGEPRP